VPALDKRTRYLLEWYLRATRQGWRLPPADVVYRLRAWHGINIDLATVSQAIQGKLPSATPTKAS